MGIEEQKEEREVLDSIFPDEITGPQSPAHCQQYMRPPEFLTLRTARHLRQFIPNIRNFRRSQRWP